MRRSSAVLGLILLTAGCQMFRAHPDSAAEAAGITLRPDQLANIMGGIKGLKPIHDGGEFAARMWVDYALFTNAVASGAHLSDSAFVADAMWADITEIRGVRWHDTLVTRRAHFGPNTVDSLYESGSVRQLQHILIKADSGSPDSIMTRARQKADQVLARLRKGEKFGKVAGEVSDDPGSRFKDGMLPVQPRGRWVRQFEDIGWKLAPGQMSGVFQTRFGYHIMRRPTVQESEDAFRQYLVHEVGAAIDSMYLDSLALRYQLEVTPGAAKLIRNAMVHPDDIRDSSATLAMFAGGTLPLSQLMRWANALPPQFTQRLVSQSDSDMVRFVKVIGQNVLLLRDADSAGIKLTAEDWTNLRGMYQDQLDTLKSALDITGQGFVDSAKAEPDRKRLVAERVDSFFTRANRTGKKLAPIPYQIAPELRRRYPHRVYADGVDDAVTQVNFPKPDSTEGARRPAMRTPPPGIPASQPAPAAAVPGKPK